MNKFSHLNIHSQYSISDGLVRLDELSSKAKDLNFESIAITDDSNLFGFVKFYKEMRDKGIKPICGVNFNSVKDISDNSESGKLTLYAKNFEGYRNLTMLVSKSHIEGRIRSIPHLKLEWLKDLNEGLILLSGDMEGHIADAILKNNFELAEARIDFFKKIFNEDFFIEISRLGREREEDYINIVSSMAAKAKIPLVATNQVRFMEEEEFEAHETRVCIQNGNVLSDPARKKNYLSTQYFKSTDEMFELFEDIPEALENSYLISQKCNLVIELGKYILPDFETPNGETEDDYLKKISIEGLHKIFGDEVKEDYFSRLDFELSVIQKMGYSGYFLIVADFVNWAKENDVPVGPGRGSGAGSLVAYAIGITGLDPIKYDLLFERFLNPDRISNPDFDIDFCKDGREKVIEYVTNKYGQDSVAQISTLGTMAARAVVRDVARAQGKSYSLADRLAKLIPFHPDMTLKTALQNKELKQAIKNDEDAEEIIEMSQKLEGLSRNVGKHAAGVVMAPSKITDFSALYLDEETGAVSTQYDMKDIELVGLQKFDFLGLKTLTIMKNALKLINQNRQTLKLDPINLDDLPLDDSKTYQLLQKGLTTAVFQLESRGIKEYIVKLKPNNFEDIITLIALYRPGPLEMNMVETYIERKHGREEFSYGDESVEKILDKTHGVIVYQEQVMQLAQEFSGFTLGEADILRRAMGKKIASEMEEQKEPFITGAIEKGKNKRFAEGLFDQIEKFAGYGFNRSHSAAYAFISYQTAWLKAHYPAEFMSAVLSSEMDDTDKIQMLLDDCKLLGLKVLPPDINSSFYEFRNIDNETLMYGLGAIKGVGKSAIESIIDNRTLKGNFKTLSDFSSRIDTEKVGKRALEPLIASGSMDSFQSSREEMFVNIESALKFAKQVSEEKKSGIDDLFGDVELPNVIPITKTKTIEFDKSLGELNSLGFYFSCHPMDEYKWEIEQICPNRISSLNEDKNIQRCAGVITTKRTIQGRRGPVTFATLDDGTEKIEIILGSDVMQSMQVELNNKDIFIVDGKVTVDNSREVLYGLAKKIEVTNINTLENLRIRMVEKLRISLIESKKSNIESFKRLLDDLDTESSIGCPVELKYTSKKSEAEIEFDEDRRILLTNNTMKALLNTYGRDNLELMYHRR